MSDLAASPMGEPGSGSLFSFFPGKVESPNGATMELLLVVENHHVRPCSDLETRMYEALKAARAVSTFLGTGGAPDLRNVVAKLDVALEPFDV